MRADDKCLNSTPFILSQVQKELHRAKRLMLFQFLHFSYCAGFCTFFRYDWFILPFPLRRRVCHHVRHQAEVRPYMGNLYLYLFFILLFYSGVKLSVHQIDIRDFDIHHYSSKIENIILETIRSYVQPPTYPLTIHKTKQFIFEKLGISINKRKIKAYLKDSLNYNYKKGSAGSVTPKLNNNKIQKSVFSSRMFAHIYKYKLIVNIN